MIFILVFLLIAFLTIRQKDAGAAKMPLEAQMFAWTAVVFIISLLPSVNIPYIYDDVDILASLAKAMHASNTAAWHFMPHNEHIIPATKFLYFVSYKYFWLNPQVFHLFIFVILAATLFLIYRFTEILTGSRFAAFLATVVFASTNLMDKAMSIVTMSTIVTCACFMLLMLYAQFRYMTTRKTGWFLLFVAALTLTPFWFGLGLGTILFVYLFHFLCVPAGSRAGGGKFLALATAVWAATLLPYLAAFSEIIHAPHYADIQKDSAIEAIDIPGAFSYYYTFLKTIVIPRLFFDPYVSFGVFFAFIYALAGFRRDIPWKKLLFFFCFGSAVTLAVFALRAGWGPGGINAPRYTVFPVIMMGFVYALSLAALEKNREGFVSRNKRWICVFALLCVCVSAQARYEKTRAVAAEMTESIQRFNLEYKVLMEKYFRENPRAAAVKLKDHPLVFYSPELGKGSGIVPALSRWTNRLSHYGRYVLPENIYLRIEWAEETDPGFLSFLRRQEQGYFRIMEQAFRPELHPAD